MGFSVNTNVSALNTFRNLTNTQNSQSKSLEKLSSGLRINRAADDAAGLSIAEGLKAQVNGYSVAARNAQDGISVVQAAEGALGESQSILQRMRDLAVQASSDTNNADARTAIKSELDELANELTRVVQSTNFNGINLLTAAATDLTVQVGAEGAGSGNTITIALAANDLETIIGAGISAAGGGSSLTVATAANGQAAIETIDTALKAVSTARSNFGATQNRLEYAISNINVAAENLTSAESRIRDVDMAKEMMNYSRTNILSQAGTAMLAQANQSNAGVLQLLG
ncbi:MULTISPECIES: flagellin N-terminal helical domain-containing protein [Oerskovia]|uniref:Flagellin n=3 Tax=Oerskovia TaxID=162491 RepID=A0ABR8RUH2_9CELL|nr:MULTISPECIES: flagellin [Oerskovia]MBD7951404.1 flagellin [Oerskovia rustica]MBM7496269.1 flagellin [Oerskovia paurometabola]QDW62446.1 flagellin [Oerskovia sp. KBS0722]